jgi:peptidoglycan/LPS O-acetylase OafA/YrhL
LIFVHGSADLGATWPTFAGGFLRALFGFCIGMLMWRYRPAPGTFRLPPWLTIALLMAILCIPGGGPLLETALVIFALPLLVYVSICADDRLGHPFLGYLGRLSYPLYIVHVPILLFTVVFRSRRTSTNRCRSSSLR